jgi:hypothetical protein
MSGQSSNQVSRAKRQNPEDLSAATSTSTNNTAGRAKRHHIDDLNAPDPPSNRKIAGLKRSQRPIPKPRGPRARLGLNTVVAGPSGAPPPPPAANTQVVGQKQHEMMIIETRGALMLDLGSRLRALVQRCGRGDVIHRAVKDGLFTLWEERLWHKSNGLDAYKNNVEASIDALDIFHNYWDRGGREKFHEAVNTFMKGTEEQATFATPAQGSPLQMQKTVFTANAVGSSSDAVPSSDAVASSANHPAHDALEALLNAPTCKRGDLTDREIDLWQLRYDLRLEIQSLVNLVDIDDELSRLSIIGFAAALETKEYSDQSKSADSYRERIDDVLEDLNTWHIDWASTKACPKRKMTGYQLFEELAYNTPGTAFDNTAPVSHATVQAGSTPISQPQHMYGATAGLAGYSSNDADGETDSEYDGTDFYGNSGENDAQASHSSPGANTSTLSSSQVPAGGLSDEFLQGLHDTPLESPASPSLSQQGPSDQAEDVDEDYPIGPDTAPHYAWPPNTMDPALLQATPDDATIPVASYYTSPPASPYYSQLPAPELQRPLSAAPDYTPTQAAAFHDSPPALSPKWPLLAISSYTSPLPSPVLEIKAPNTEPTFDPTGAAVQTIPSDQLDVLQHPSGDVSPPYHNDYSPFENSWLLPGLAYHTQTAAQINMQNHGCVSPNPMFNLGGDNEQMDVGPSGVATAAEINAQHLGWASPSPMSAFDDTVQMDFGGYGGQRDGVAITQPYETDNNIAQPSTSASQQPIQPFQYAIDPTLDDTEMGETGTSDVVPTQQVFSQHGMSLPEFKPPSAVDSTFRFGATSTANPFSGFKDTPEFLSLDIDAPCPALFNSICQAQSAEPLKKEFVWKFPSEAKPFIFKPTEVAEVLSDPPARSAVSSGPTPLFATANLDFGSPMETKPSTSLSKIVIDFGANTADLDSLKQKPVAT